MPLSRRQFLRVVGATAGAATVADLLRAPLLSVPAVEAAPLAPEQLRSLADAALDRARKLGCS